MRFIWLSLSIVAPLVAVNFIANENERIIILTYMVVAALTEIVLLALTVSEFVKYQKAQEYVVHRKIECDRDEDIAKWRKEFSQDTLNLYDMQKESLKRARDVKRDSDDEIGGNKVPDTSGNGT